MSSSEFDHRFQVPRVLDSARDDRQQPQQHHREHAPSPAASSSDGEDHLDDDRDSDIDIDVAESTVNAARHTLMRKVAETIARKSKLSIPLKRSSSHIQCPARKRAAHGSPDSRSPDRDHLTSDRRTEPFSPTSVLGPVSDDRQFAASASAGQFTISLIFYFMFCFNHVLTMSCSCFAVA